MPALAHPRHELFAQFVASGKSASEAYRQSGATGKNADVHAARLMVNDGICKRMSEIREEHAAKCEMNNGSHRTRPDRAIKGKRWPLPSEGES